MLNFMPKTGQKGCVACTHEGNDHRQYVRLRPPVRKVAGYAAHGQRRQYHGNVGVIRHRQLVFCLERNVLNVIRLVAV